MPAFRTGRREHKYELSPAVAAALRADIATRLPLYSYIPGRTETFVSTVYFDTVDRVLFRRAERSFDDNLKIRVKEYFYPVGNSANGRSAGDERIVRRENETIEGGLLVSPTCYVELKERTGGVVTKRRLALPKAQVPRLFAGEDVAPFIEGVNGVGTHGAGVASTYSRLCRELSRARVECSSIVVYHRVVYQESESDLRITFDDAIRVYAPRSDLYDRHSALTPAVLGEPLRRLDKTILEIKCPREYPAWLKSTLRRVSTKRLSKFTSSVRLVLKSGSRRPGEAGDA